jgi:hypothetical protein
MFRPIRMDHTNCLQVAIKSIQFNSVSAIKLGVIVLPLSLAAFSSMLKSKCGLILAKAAALRINLKLDGAPLIRAYHLSVILT